ncbi:MAG: DUF2062 domain-containing protein [Geminicoccaceae bacterium]
MVFRRKNPLPWYRRLRQWLWPEAGVWRASKYLVFRVKRLQGTPHFIAAGVASGAAVSFLPFPGFHFLLGFLASFVTRGSFLAAMAGTLVGNPWTFPLMWGGGLAIGRSVMGRENEPPPPPLSEIRFADWDHHLEHLFIPAVIGSIPLALLAWMIVYLLCKQAVISFRARGERKRAAALARAAKLPADTEAGV